MAESGTVKMRSKVIPKGKTEHVIVVGRDRVKFFEGRGFEVVADHAAKPGEIAGTGAGSTKTGG